jgi:CBS-domain-containing membrane protein
MPMKIRDLMSKNPTTCSPGDTLDRAARLMWEADVGSLPVLDDDGRCVGIVTDRDVCMAAYTQGVALRESLVASAMTHDVTLCSPESSIKQVEALMAAKQIRRIPVVDAGAVVVGIVSLADLARYSQSSPLHIPSVPGLVRTLATIVQPRANGAAHAAE